MSRRRFLGLTGTWTRRPINGTLSYFNVDWSAEGVIAALGWPGQWTAQMTRDAEWGLRVQGRMSSNDPAQQPVLDIRFTQLIDLWLEPGDEIRDMWSAGIVDPVPVQQTALEAAVSGTVMTLTADVLVHGRESRKVAKP